MLLKLVKRRKIYGDNRLCTHNCCTCTRTWGIQQTLKIPEIIELLPLFGEYDLIAKIEAEYFEKLGEVVVSKIRSIEGVIDTKTLTGPKIL